MKNFKNILASLVLVTVMGVSTSFAGVLIGDRQVVTEDPKTDDTVVCSNENGGIMISNGGIMISGGFTGIMISFTGIMISGSFASDAPACDK